LHFFAGAKAAAAAGVRGAMLRRDPTAIEIQEDDLIELKKAREARKHGASSSTAKAKPAAPRTPDDSSRRAARERRIYGQGS